MKDAGPDNDQQRYYKRDWVAMNFTFQGCRLMFECDRVATRDK